MLLKEILSEARIIKDFRHQDKFAELPYWPQKEDPKFIKPEDGFHFIYAKGELVLHSTSNATYDGVIALGFIDAMKKSTSGVPRNVQLAIKGAGTDTWNQFGGIVNLETKTITIHKEYVQGKSRQRQRALNDIKDIKAAFKNLKRYGVTDDFKLKGVASPFNGMKIGDFIKHADPVEQLDKLSGIVFYHGTSKKRWDESISKRGLRPGRNGNEIYVDLIPGYSDHNVYLASTPKIADFYGKRQAEKDADDHYVVIEVNVPDVSKLVPDDHFARHKKSGDEHKLVKTGLRELGSVAYKGTIFSKFLKLHSTKKA